jgi:hypothetical protein
VLVVLACLLALLSVVVVFARNQLLNTDTYVATVAPLASNPDIQAAVAKQVSSRLITKIDVEKRVKNALPPRAGFLATPIAAEVQSVTDQLALKLVESPAFEKAWVAANRASHKQLVAVLTGSTQGSLSSSNGKITIDLSNVEAQVKKKLDGKGITIFDKVPAVKGLNFVLFQSDDLTKIQRWVRFLNHLVVVLPIVAILCFAGGVVLTDNRRRGLVRAAAGLALTMALILVALAVVRNQYLNGLDPSRSRAANAAVIDTVTSTLRGTVRTVLIVAAVVAVLAVIAGNRAVRRWVGRRGAPDALTTGPVHRFAVDHRKVLQWTVLILGLIVLVIWNNPTTLVAVVVILITLAVVGLVGVVGTPRTGGAPEASGEEVDRPALEAGVPVGGGGPGPGSGRDPAGDADHH